jgi:hypothetical protein
VKSKHRPSPNPSRDLSLKLAFLSGIIGLGFSAFSASIYFLHILYLSVTSVEATRYMASTHSIAVTLFVLSLSLDLLALLNHKSSLSLKLMLASTVCALMGYLPPAERLWKLGYINSLDETILIAAIHVLTLTTSSLFLNKSLKEKNPG